MEGITNPNDRMPAARTAVGPIRKLGCIIPYFCVVRFQVVLLEQHMLKMTVAAQLDAQSLLRPSLFRRIGARLVRWETGTLVRCFNLLERRRFGEFTVTMVELNTYLGTTGKEERYMQHIFGFGRSRHPEFQTSMMYERGRIRRLGSSSSFVA